MSETKPLTWTTEDEAKIRKWSAAYGDSEHYVGRTLIELDAERKAHEQTREQLAHSIDVTPPESKEIDRLVYGTEDNVTFLYKELQSLRQMQEIARELKEALGKLRCFCKQEWEDECPTCGCKLFAVRNNPTFLNDDQFASVRAGDFYCRTCKGTEARSGYKYWWKKDLKEKREQCARCTALAKYHAQFPEADAQKSRRANEPI